MSNLLFGVLIPIGWVEIFFIAMQIGPSSIAEIEDTALNVDNSTGYLTIILVAAKFKKGLSIRLKRILLIFRIIIRHISFKVY